jgi:hypothetical protein
MSVMMGLRIDVNPERFEQVVKDNKDTLDSIAARARQAGAIHHQFLAGDGAVLVADEWPDETSFLGFFEAAGADIGSLMAQAGVTNEPKPTFWRRLDTSDRF